MLISMAWRNIWRNPLRSGILIVSLVTGLLAGSFILAFFNGMRQEQMESAIRRRLSHLQLHHPDFRMEENPDQWIKDADTVGRFFQQLPSVNAVCTRLLLSGMASSAHGAAGVHILGVDAAAEAGLTGLNQHLLSGNYFSSFSIVPEVIIGRKLGEKLQLNAEQKLVLTFQNARSELTAAAFRISGIYSGSNTISEATDIYVNDSSLALLADIPSKTAHEVAVLLHRHDQLEEVLAISRHHFPQLETVSWKDLAPELRLMVESFELYMFIVIGIMLLALLFGMINTMLMAVMERKRELGVLMAVGMNRKRVFLMLVLETLFTALSGCLLGLPLAMLVINWTALEGIDLSRWSQGLSMYGLSTKVYPVLEFRYFIQIGIMAAVAALIAAIYPAQRALQLKPAEAIRK